MVRVVGLHLCREIKYRLKKKFFRRFYIEIENIYIICKTSARETKGLRIKARNMIEGLWLKKNKEWGQSGSQTVAI